MANFTKEEQLSIFNEKLTLLNKPGAKFQAEPITVKELRDFGFTENSTEDEIEQAAKDFYDDLWYEAEDSKHAWRYEN